ncbi:MAG: leucine--tRNA ligase [Thaumarchaeota archaeon]|nr:leucine--tRNA ligase [Nitrososphaerota archaeon]
MEERERYWLKVWNERKVHESDPVKGKKKIFVTFPYPYMNGPVHVGHCFTATRVDIYARFKRMQGYNVLFPWAWHWTGESIVGMSYRLAQGDEGARRALVEADGVPESEVDKFKDPEYLASYYTKVSRKVVKDTGLSIDWRREFTTVDPAFKRFVEWQYTRLRELGYVVQGTHPVVWCSLDQSPTGDHDRMEGEGASPEEFYLVKFGMGDFALVGGTLRTETIYGTVNVWVNPDAEYSEANVDGELWIISSSAVKRLSEQKRAVTPLRSFKGTDLVGREVKSPITGRMLPVLPSAFVDPELATGIVPGEPADAPYDLQALEEIRSGKIPVSRQVKEVAEKIRPISIIAVPGYSEFPAADAIKKFGIKDSTDSKLLDATAEVYKVEFHRGVMKPNTGPLAGMKVGEAREKAAEAMLKEGTLSKMLELSEKVVCRCGTRCYVKILENQWFLNYSNEKWKARTKGLIEKAAVFPPESRQLYYATIDWLRDWPCARRSGMGTKLPWDKEWIVETLSDSTIYMAFYMINKFVSTEKIKPANLTLELFDYVLLGRGRVGNVAKAAHASENIVKSMREDFLYWYPVDLRNSAKELIPNHLTFFAFHHAALFEEARWPRAFSVNGMIQIDGTKMSKTKGNFVTWGAALEKYGADPLRATLALAADGMDDADWTGKNAEDMRSKVESLLPSLAKVLEDSVDREPNELDAWLISTTNRRIASVTTALEEMKIRRAFSIAFLDIWNDLRWYNRRCVETRRDTLLSVFLALTRLLSPFIPFASEELNRTLGGKGLASQADWPSPRDYPLDERAELSELVVARVLEDARNLLRIVKGETRRLYIYTPSPQAVRFFAAVTRSRLKKENVGIVLKEFPDIGISPDRVIKLQYDLGEEIVGKFLSQPDFDEHKLLIGAADFLASELGREVKVMKASTEGMYDPKGRAKDALPLKPAFFLE